MDISSPKYSFVQFNAPASGAPCCDEDSSFCIPVVTESDTYFQFRINCATFAETQDVWNSPIGDMQLVLLKGTGNTPATLAANTLRNWTFDDSLQFEKNRTGTTEITYQWRQPFKDVMTLVDCDGCFQLAIINVTPNPQIVVFSNCFTRICEDCFTSVLDYNNEDDAYDFRYCNVVDPLNRVRLPFYFSQPQFPDEETVYVYSNGRRKVLKSVTNKEFQAQTDHWPEWVHEKLKFALGHDYKKLTSDPYTGEFVKSGAYEIEWIDDICTAPAKFKAFVSPYAGRNSNCADCEPVDLGCPIPLNVQASVVNNGDGTQTITFSWANVLSGITAMTIGFRVHGSGLPFSSNTGGFTSPRPIDLPLGDYDFKFTTHGTVCDNASSPVYEDIGTDGSCDGVAFDGTPALPDATAGTPYNYSFDLTGDGPFAINTVVKPAWMTIAVVSNSIVFSGTPPAPATDVSVSFNITNCSASFSIAFSDTMDVEAMIPGNIVLDCGGSPSMDPITFGTAGTYSFYNVPITVITPGTVTLTAHNDQAGSLSGYSMYKQYTATVTAGQTSIDFEVDYDGGGIHTIFEMTFQATDTSGTDTCTGNLYSFI